MKEFEEKLGDVLRQYESPGSFVKHTVNHTGELERVKDAASIAGVDGFETKPHQRKKSKRDPRRKRK